jgi:hypothetical protein
MRKVFPESYDFFPQTWLLPAESGELLKQFNTRPKTTVTGNVANGYNRFGAPPILKDTNPAEKYTFSI